MNFAEMTVEELQLRKTEIPTLIDAEDADLDALENELREINAELEKRVKAQEQRQRILDDVAAGKVETEVVEEEPIKERTMTDIKEIRASQEYAQAYLNLLKTNDDAECRALLTADATAATGYVPVPTALETEIRTAWENHRLMSLVKKSSFKGHVKIGFELSATAATVHLEGANAPDEETVTLGTVEITNQMIKKWISVSDEALEGTTVDTMGYIFKEIAQRITEKAEDILVGKITGAGTVATATAVGVPKLQDDPGKDTVANALALLCGQAGNIHIAMNRATYPAFRALELNANYAVDVFEGLKDRIVFTDKLPAYSAATTGVTYMIVGDFSGAQANFPNGDSMQMLTDPYTDATKDLVRVIGREYVGMGLVADKHFVNVTKEAAAG